MVLAAGSGTDPLSIYYSSVLHVSRHRPVAIEIHSISMPVVLHDSLMVAAGVAVSFLRRSQESVLRTEAEFRL